MKKILLLCFICILLTCGCGKFDINEAKDKLTDKITSSKGYELKGTMEIYNNEDTFKYDITVNYEKDDKYRVSMINQNNNHEQIILKNEDEVYVVTPSLNKSFKFESQWPDNSSQSYVLSSIINDMNNDAEATFEKKDNKYIIQNKVNYPHNKSLSYQKLYLDKSMNLQQVIVYDNQNTQKIKVVINSLDLKAKFNDDFFELESLIQDKEDEQEESENEERKTTQLDEVIYPLYIPENTYLKSTDTINDEYTDRTILTFNGDKSFVLVEEIANASSEFEIIPVNGDPLILNNSIAALSDNSLTWRDNNIEYYLTSSDLSTDELMTIAASLGTTPVYVEK